MDLKLKRGSVYVVLALIFLFNIIPVSATNIDELSIEIEIYSDGIVKVSEKLVFDSRGVDGYVYLPAVNPESIIIHDDKQELKYATVSGFILFSPVQQEESYHVQLQYLTNSLTYKKGEVWDFLFILPSREELGYDSIKSTEVSVYLPAKSLVTFASGQHTFTTTDSNIIRLAWRPDLVERKELQIGYELPVNVIEKNETILVLLVVVFGVILATLIGYNILDKHVVRVSSGKKDLIKTLDKREQVVVEMLMDEKGKTTQSLIHKKAGMSKATLSRAVMRLQQKNIIKAEARGNVNDLYLTDWFKKK